MLSVWIDTPPSMMSVPPLSELAMIDPESAKDLDDPKAFLAEYPTQEDLTATDFWDGWASLAHMVENRANSPNASPDLRARY